MADGLDTSHRQPRMGGRLNASTQIICSLVERYPRLVDGGAGLVVGGLVPLGDLLGTYAAGRYRRGWDAWPALAGLQVAATTLALLHAHQDWAGLVGTLASNLVLQVLVFLFGRRGGTRHARMAGLAERADRLQREREQEAHLAAARERARISQEMHDIIAHNLTVMVALADGAAITASSAPERAANIMQKVSTTGREALTEMRRVLRAGLVGDGPHLGPQPGFADLDPLIEHVRAAGVAVAMTQQGEPAAWGPSAGLAVYRILQEALTNTMKHAGTGASANVWLRYTPGEVNIEVTDNGAGRPAAPVADSPGARALEPTGGYGLLGLAERAAAFGGQLQAGPTTGGGWRVHAHLRFDEEPVP